MTPALARFVEASLSPRARYLVGKLFGCKQERRQILSYLADVPEREDRVLREFLLNLKAPLAHHAVTTEVRLDIFHLLRDRAFPVSF